MKKFIVILPLIIIAIMGITILVQQENSLEIVTFPDGQEIGAREVHYEGGNMYYRYLTPEEFREIDKDQYHVDRTVMDSMTDAITLRQVFFDNKALLMDSDAMLGKALKTWPVDRSIAKN